MAASGKSATASSNGMCAPTPSRSSASCLRSGLSSIPSLLAVLRRSPVTADVTLPADDRLPRFVLLARDVRRRPHAAPAARRLDGLRRGDPGRRLYGPLDRLLPAEP